MELSIIDAKERFPGVPTGRLGCRLRPLKLVIDQNGYRVASIFKRESRKRGGGTYWVVKVVADNTDVSFAFDYRDRPDTIWDFHYIGEFKTIREVRKAVANITPDDLNRRTPDGWINRTALPPSTK